MINKKTLAIVIASLAASSAFAQSNVTVYGVIDTAVRYTTDQAGPNGTAGSQTAMMEGAFQGPRLGFKGQEDLGGGMAAVFQLEAGFLANNGTSDQQGQLFGRQAFVGLKDKSLGELDAGRQYGVAFDTMENYDPLGIGNFNENSWEAVIWGLRFDNTVKYTNSFGPVKVEAQYSLGGQTGTINIGSTKGLALTYTQDAFSIGGFLQQSVDANALKLNVIGAGGSYVVGPATLYINYFNAKRDAGFEKAASNSGGPLANTSLMGNIGNTLQRTDSMWTVGTLYQVTPAIGLTVAYMTDGVSNESSLGDSGRISTGYAVADYNLSKRTDVYLEFDRTKLSGGEVGDSNTVALAGLGTFNGNSARTGISAGVRVKF